jgi:hypothetical protein
MDRPVALWDTPLEIVVSELAPYERGKLRATTTDYAGKTWASSTTVHADGVGRVDLHGIAAMRVLWSMRPLGAGPATDLYVPPRGGERIRLTLGARGQTVAGTSVKRLLLAASERVRSLRPVRFGFYGEMFEPRSTRVPHPGVLLFGGS